MTTGYLLFVLSTLGLIVLVGISTYRTAKLLRVWQPEQNVLLLPAENALRIIMILLCLFLGWLSGVAPSILGWYTVRPFYEVSWGIVVGALMALLFLFATRWVVAWGGTRFYSSMILELILPHSLTEAIGVMLAMIPAVLFEELLFRSLLLGGVGQVILPIPLLIASSVLFGLMHSPQGVWGMFGASIAGILLGLLFLWQESLLLPTVAHYVANLIQIGIAMRQQTSRVGRRYLRR